MERKKISANKGRSEAMSTIYIKNIKNDNQITTGRLFDEQPNSIQCNIRVDVINHIGYTKLSFFNLLI